MITRHLHVVNILHILLLTNTVHLDIINLDPSLELNKERFGVHL